MAQSFVRSVLVLVLLNLLVKPVWIFGIDRKVQVLAGWEQYGIYFSYLGFTVIFNMLADAGITLHVQQQVAARQVMHTAWLRKAVHYKLWLSVLYLLVTGVFASLSGLHVWPLLLALICLQLLQSWLSFARAILSAQQQFTTSTVLSVLDKLLLLLPGVVLLYLVQQPISVLSFAAWQAAATAVALGAAVYWLLQKSMQRNPQPADDTTAPLLRGSLPLAAIIIMMFLHSRSDAVLLSLLHEDKSTQSGMYASMFRFVDAATVLSALAAGFLLSFWARHLQQRNLLRQTMDQFFRMMTAAAVLVALVFFFFAGELQQWLYHTQSPLVTEVLRWGMIVLVPAFMVDVFGTLLTANRKLSTFLWIAGCCAALNIIANVLLIPSYGALAPALVAIGTHTLFALLLLRTCAVNWQVFPAASSWLRLSLLTLLLIAAITALRNSTLPVWVQLVGTVAVWGAMVMALRLFSLSWIVRLKAEN